MSLLPLWLRNLLTPTKASSHIEILERELLLQKLSFIDQDYAILATENKIRYLQSLEKSGGHPFPELSPPGLSLEGEGLGRDNNLRGDSNLGR